MRLRMIHTLAGAFMATLAGVVPGVTHAGVTDLYDMKVGLHLQPRGTKNWCEAGRAGTREFGCNAGYGEYSELVVNGATETAYDMYIVLLDILPAVGLQSVRLALEYMEEPTEGVQIFGMEACADDVFPDPGWPAPGTAITFTWNTCQNTVDPTDPQEEATTVAAAVYVYAYSMDRVCVEHPSNNNYTAVDCSGASWDWSYFRGCTGFDRPGIDPCLVIYSPVEETTWGSIKRQY